MLNTRYDTFLTLCELNSYTKTAERLNMTQPAVTQHIQYLEAHYGCKLFVYKNRRPELTEQGRQLRHYVSVMRADSRRIDDIIANSAGSRTAPLFFGATRTIGEYVVAESLAAIWRAYPDTRINMVVDNTQVLLDKLNEGSINFALIEGIFDKNLYTSSVLSDEKFIGVCAADSPLAHGRYTLSSLLGHRLIVREKGSGTRDVLEQALRADNLTVSSFKNISEIDNMGAIKQLVSKGCGISFMYEAAVKKELADKTLARLDIESFTYSHAFSFVFLADSIHSGEYMSWYRFFRSHIMPV